MSRYERATEQTRIRRLLLANGYVPLANRDKRCLLPGWPGLVVTDDLVDEWSSQLRWVATGVRVAGRLVVVDMDIDDDAVLDAIWAGVDEDVRYLMDAAPMRFGGGAKVALFMRLADGEPVFGRLVSQAWAPPGSDVAQRVEVFGAGTPRQFGVFGVRSFGEDGSVATEYAWSDGWSLCDVALAELPSVTVDELKAICDTASRVMRAAGWTYEVATLDGAVDGRSVFDLDAGMVFETEKYGEVDLAGLESLCDAEGAGGADGVRLSASWLEGAVAQNKTRCIARLNAGDGRLQIWESASCVLHRPASLDLGGKVTALAERLLGRVGVVEGAGGGAGGDRLAALLAAVPVERRLFGGPVDEGGDGAEEDAEEAEAARRAAIMAHLLAEYAYWPAGPGYVLSLTRPQADAMSFGSFRALVKPLEWQERKSTRKNAAVESVNPADLWLAHPDRVDVSGLRFLPMCKDRLAVVGDEQFVNTWSRPTFWDEEDAVDDWDEVGGAVDTFRTFLRHLIPDERERAWFTMWLAAKTQKPWLPNCGVVMVAERQGTGRGTLFDLVRGVFGGRHVRSVAAVQLIGGGSQSQYTDWQESALIVTCDEVLAGDDAGGAMAWKRREVYERLKALIDPRPRSVPIVRKGLPNTEAEVHASFLLATNNVNALPLAPDDRRIAVVTNTGVPLAERPSVLGLLERWRTDVGFDERLCGAVYRWLRQREVVWSEVRESPRWMAGRERMLSANEGDLEGVLENVLRGLAGDYVLGHHLRERVGRSLEANGMLGEIKGWWPKTQDVLGRMNRLGWRRLDGRHRFAPVSVTNNTALVFYREGAGGPEAWAGLSLEDRVRVCADGDPAKAASQAVGRKMLERGLSVVDGRAD